MSSSSGRIQIKLCGRRFEFSRDVALESMGLLKEFFSVHENSQEKQDQLCAKAGCVHERGQQKLIGGATDDTLDIFSFDSSVDSSSSLPTSTPDYFGLIQVALRKNKEPAFNWQEMNAKEQASVVWIVNTFKIEKFIEKFGSVGVAVATEIDGNDERANSKATNEGEEVEKVLDTMADALAKAHIKIAEAQDAQREEARRKQEEERDQRRQQKAAAMKDNAESSSDDENVALTGVGCFFCGVATHNEDVCRFNPKNMVANEGEGK